MTIRRATCRANGIRQFYLEAGAGPPVVLLHGFPETSFAWRFQIPALARHYRVIAPDLPGYGETDKPSKGYDKRTMANDVVALLESASSESICRTIEECVTDRRRATAEKLPRRQTSMKTERYSANLTFSISAFCAQLFLPNNPLTGCGRSPSFPLSNRRGGIKE